MAKLADDVETELQRRKAEWDATAQRTNDRLQQGIPLVETLLQRLADLESHIEQGIDASLSQVTQSAAESSRTVDVLQQLLAVTMKTVLDGNAQLAHAHEKSIQLAGQRASYDFEVLTSTMQGALSVSLTLQENIVRTVIFALLMSLPGTHCLHGLFEHI